MPCWADVDVRGTSRPPSGDQLGDQARHVLIIPSPRDKFILLFANRCHDPCAIGNSEHCCKSDQKSHEFMLNNFMLPSSKPSL